MTQRNPRMQGSPALIWAGLAFLLLGAFQGSPSTFTGHALQTGAMVGSQLLLLGTMLSQAWRAGRASPRILMLLTALLLASALVQLLPLWRAWP